MFLSAGRDVASAFIRSREHPANIEQTLLHVIGRAAACGRGGTFTYLCFLLCVRIGPFYHLGIQNDPFKTLLVLRTAT